MSSIFAPNLYAIYNGNQKIAEEAEFSAKKAVAAYRSLEYASGRVPPENLYAIQIIIPEKKEA